MENRNVLNKGNRYSKLKFQLKYTNETMPFFRFLSIINICEALVV